MKVKIDINKILKDIGQDGNPAISLKAVQQVVDKVEFEFRNAGYGINDTEVKIIDINSTNDTIDLGYVPKFKKANPTSLKKGDLFLGFSVNCKGRQMVIAKIVKDMAYCISLTTTKDEYALIPHESRFLEEGFYCNSFTVVKLEYIKKNFIGIMDDTRNLNKSAKLITEKIRKDLNIK